MRSLRHLQLTSTTLTIETADGPQDIQLRPLNTEDLEYIFRTNPGDVKDLFEKFTNKKLNTDVLREAVSRYPRIAATVIGVASEMDLDASFEDIEANVKAARRLQVPYQILAIDSIMRETFVNEGGLASFLEAVTRAFNSVSSVALSLQDNTTNQTPTTALESGSGISDEI